MLVAVPRIAALFLVALASAARAAPRADAETFARLEAWAETCAGPWEGTSGCYEARIRTALEGLPEAARAVDALAGRSLLLPDEAHERCLASRPKNARGALDEASAWCAAGRDECVEALREVRRVLLAMPAWEGCIERMEGRANAPPPSPPSPAKPAPPSPLASEPEPPPTDDPIKTTPDTATISGTRTHPKGIDDGRREGQLAITVAPFSGVLTLRDPATGAEHRPMLASVGLGVSGVLELSEAIGLELGLGARASFGSTAMGQAVAVSLDELETETGTAIVVELEPTAIVLSQYLGAGLVVGVRWDTIGVTSLANGLTSHEISGAAAGLRVVLGLGLLERDMRLVGNLDWIFIGAGSTVLRAALQAELGPLLVAGAYRQHFRLGAATDAWVVDELQLTLGYRAAF